VLHGYGKSNKMAEASLKLIYLSEISCYLSAIKKIGGKLIITNNG